jgi:ssDNA-binding Zn-finger/Zn-ribbon topoisomerase 1
VSKTKKNAYGENMLQCPECDSERVIVRSVQAFMANTGEHYCHSVKAHDANASANCLDCGWDGQRQELKGYV